MAIDPDSLAQWLAIPPEELTARSPLELTIVDTRTDLYRHFAQEMFDEMVDAQREHLPSYLH